jgi:hypothetical protein
MERSKMLLFAILGLILLGFIHSRVSYPTTTTTTTTSKAVVVKQPVHYGYVPPPHYNPYKAQYYN